MVRPTTCQVPMRHGFARSFLALRIPPPCDSPGEGCALKLALRAPACLMRLFPWSPFSRRSGAGTQRSLPTRARTGTGGRPPCGGDAATIEVNVGVIEQHWVG